MAKKFDVKEIWPSIQGFLKGFPKNLKPMMKDPVTNMQQLEARRKEVWGGMYTTLALLIVFVLLSLIPVVGSIISILNIIPIAGLMFFGFLLWMLGKIADKFKAFTCGGCGKMLDLKDEAQFSKYVVYDIVSEKSNTGVSHPASKDGVVPYVEATGDVTSVIKVTFTCPDCGAQKTFTYTVTPLKLKVRSKNVVVAGVETAKVNLQNNIRAVLDMYENGDGAKIPYSIASIHHPRYEERTKLQTKHESYRGVDIVYHRDIDELVEGLFIRNEMNGSIKSE